jgi:hypothetical protein
MKTSVVSSFQNVRIFLSFCRSKNGLFVQTGRRKWQTVTEVGTVWRLQKHSRIKLTLLVNQRQTHQKGLAYWEKWEMFDYFLSHSKMATGHRPMTGGRRRPFLDLASVRL